ncbi:ComF family protein [Thiomicrorhabdus chilensis]|uniref:ComF family protein n=1 Tax=Thiomicrorhabdus chilensis TaxID=63656 RepID=UPI000427DB55|nr:ComF family protein [Thiomicrorhabdus chilensis]
MHWLEKWIMPPTCVITGRASEYLDLSQPLVEGWQVPLNVCPCCCEPSSLGLLCGACLTDPPAFDRTQAGFYFDKELVDLVHGLKYQRQLAYGRILADVLAERLQTESVEALLAVPLYAKRRRNRGYNQAELIAQALSKKLQIPLLPAHAVQRIKDTPSQTHLDAQQRRRNLKGAFLVDNGSFEGLNQIALIDDVITTGATMQQLAKSIKTNTQIKTIQAWAVCKTK